MEGKLKKIPPKKTTSLKKERASSEGEKRWERFIRRASKAYRVYQEKEELWRYGEVFLTLITITFFLIFALRPTVAAISSLLAEIKNKQELVQKMRLKVNQIVEAQTNFAAVQEEISLLDNACPTSFQLAEGAAQLVGLAGEEGLWIDSFSFSPVEFGAKKGKNEGVKFSLTLRGEYSQLKAFLKKVKQLRRLVKVEGYYFSQPKKEGEKRLNFNLRGELLYFNSLEGEK